MGSSTRRELTDRQRYWLEQLQACEASGQKMSAYAADQGLGVRALYDARKRLVQQGVLSRSKRQRPVFERVRVSAPCGAASTRCRIEFPNGVTLELGGEAVDHLALLQALGALP
jgi:hypothetical protein